MDECVQGRTQGPSVERRLELRLASHASEHARARKVHMLRAGGRHTVPANHLTASVHHTQRQMSSSSVGTYRGPHSTPLRFFPNVKTAYAHRYMSSPLAQSSPTSSPSTHHGSSLGIQDGDSEDDDDDLTASHAPSTSVLTSLSRRRVHRQGRALGTTSRQMLTPGPLKLARPSGSTSGGDESATSSRLRRQQFRQKCQEAMAQDRKRDRERILAHSRHPGHTGEVDSSEEDIQQSNSVLRSDDLSSSDVDEASWGDEEVEVSGKAFERHLGSPLSTPFPPQMARRVLAGDYKRMLHEQERDGSYVAWLDPDEVAWLEEEVRREEAQQHGQSSGVCLAASTTCSRIHAGVEPPLDMVDEDEDLYAQFQHAGQTKGGEESDDDEAFFSSLNEDEWQLAATEDVIMRDG